MQLFSKIHRKVILKLKVPNFIHPQTFVPILHPLYMMLILVLYTQSRLCFQIYKIILKIFHLFYILLKPKMCFGAPAKIYT